VGKSNQHQTFPGAICFSCETLGPGWFEFGESVTRAGCRKIVFFNSHGGRPQLVDMTKAKDFVQCRYRGAQSPGRSLGPSATLAGARGPKHLGS
jgi:creatinine amidohydrolase/Fe(II)-dependent formamide hydrolase-like protein